MVAKFPQWEFLILISYLLIGLYITSVQPIICISE